MGNIAVALYIGLPWLGGGPHRVLFCDAGGLIPRREAVGSSCRCGMPALPTFIRLLWQDRPINLAVATAVNCC